MPTVEVSRFVPETRPALERLLSPASVLEYEGTFAVGDVAETDAGTVVTARAAGRLMEVRFVFEEREDGLVYRQHGDGGPFETMETVVTLEPENEGTRVTMRSTLRLGLPLPLVDRIAAWKRRGELRRALANLADAA